VTRDAERIAPTHVLTEAEHDELTKQETQRTERAQAVVSRSAEARTELLLKEGFETLAGRAPAEVRIETQTVPAFIE
jgi:hypothetical protein